MEAFTLCHLLDKQEQPPLKHASSSETGKLLVEQWTTALIGLEVEVRRRGRTVCRGLVDDVTPDGSVVWIHPLAEQRRLCERSESYELWTHPSA